MHVAGCAVFDGRRAGLRRARARRSARRLHLVPRYRQRLAFVPVRAGSAGVGRRSAFQGQLPRPPHGAARARATTTSSSGSPGACSRRRSIASRPLWELWLVEGLAAIASRCCRKTHHALVDGVSGVDIATVLFDASPDPLPVAPPEQDWIPRPLPTGPQLLADALLERATVPAEIVRGARRALRGPRQVGGRLGAGARRRRGAGLGRAAGRAARARSTCGSDLTAGSPGSAAS